MSYEPKDVSVCKWTETDECYETDCGKAFSLNDGSLKDNGMLFCCFCGKRIEEERLSENNGDLLVNQLMYQSLDEMITWPLPKKHPPSTIPSVPSVAQ